MKLKYSHDVHTPSWVKIGIGDLLEGEMGWIGLTKNGFETVGWDRPYRRRNGLIETEFHYGWDRSGNPFDYPIWVYR